MVFLLLLHNVSVLTQSPGLATYLRIELITFLSSQETKAVVFALPPDREGQASAPA